MKPSVEQSAAYLLDMRESAFWANREFNKRYFSLFALVLNILGKQYIHARGRHEAS